ncbi:MFS transporter [Thalassotalea fonticola]|uniref:MFS transporter n=1 Tax=Thalassotalea fonticola TaxID=3065649 RepID=A0ABZ0GM03_9GAMM|nr:MFS transporter [Colwelliaceae bacterium S1-1]
MNFTTKEVISTSIISALGALMFLLLPVIIGITTDNLNLSEQQSGLLVSFYFLGFLVACVLSPFITTKFDWKNVGYLGGLFMTTGLILIAFLPSYQLVLIFLSLIGLGSGTLFSLAIVILSKAENAERYFGIKIMFEQVLGALLLFIIPAFIVTSFGYQGSFLAISCTVILLGSASYGLPKTARITNKGIMKVADKTSSSLSCNIKLWIALFCLCLFFGALSTLWSFVERLAVTNKLAGDDIGLGLSLSVMGGAVGGFLAAYIGNKLNLKKSILLITPLILLIVWAFYLQFTFVVFTLAAFSLSLCWNFSLAYQMKIVINQDESKASWLASFLAIGGIICPAVGGFLLGGAGWLGLFSAITFILIICSIGFYNVCSNKRALAS